MTLYVCFTAQNSRKLKQLTGPYYIFSLGKLFQKTTERL